MQKEVEESMRSSDADDDDDSANEFSEHEDEDEDGGGGGDGDGDGDGDEDEDEDGDEDEDEDGDEDEDEDGDEDEDDDSQSDDTYRKEARLRENIKQLNRTARLERAKRRQEKENSAQAIAYGDPTLSIDTYWQNGSAANGWGVLEVSTRVGEEGSYYATSVFWGLSNRTSAGLLANFCNTVHRAYDPRRHRAKQFAVFSAPPCTVTVAIRGARALHLALTSDFPVRHRPQRWTETIMLAQDYYLYEANQKYAVQDSRLMAHLTQTFFSRANTALPVALFDTQTAGCFIKPEGIEARPATTGDKDDARLANDTASDDDHDDDDDDDDDDKAASERESDEDDMMDFDE